MSILAHGMVDGSPMGLRLTKQALNALIDAPHLDTALMIEDRQQVILHPNYRGDGP